MNEPSKLLKTMMAIAAEAAELVMEVYQTPFAVDYKGPSDPVTLADRKADALICEKLGAAFPDIPIVDEESPSEKWANYRDAERVFFVDPVDGTREFVAKNGQFVVMIGLVEGDRPTRGVLHAPALKQIWAAEPEFGAVLIDAEGQERRLPPLTSKPLKDATLIASRSKSGRLTNDEIEFLSPKEVISIGSAGLKGAAVADGRADVYYARKYAGCLWDTCAPEALIRALGGEFSNARGELIDYRGEVTQKSGAVAAAPDLHRELIDTLAQR